MAEVRASLSRDRTLIGTVQTEYLQLHPIGATRRSAQLSIAQLKIIKASICSGATDYSWRYQQIWEVSYTESLVVGSDLENCQQPLRSCTSLPLTLDSAIVTLRIARTSSRTKNKSARFYLKIFLFALQVIWSSALRGVQYSIQTVTHVRLAAFPLQITQNRLVRHI